MLLKKMSDMTKQFLKDRPNSQWGISIDGSMGFGLSSPTATWQEMSKTALSFVPYIKAKVFQVMSIEESDEVLKSMMQQK